MSRWPRRFALAGVVAAVASGAEDAQAFGGFHVGGAEAKVSSSATMVVVMREGPRTIVSIQAHYKGPSEAFAMVVPVPVVVDPADVKTLPRDVFERVDRLSAPRLVEYWEQDPCSPARRKPDAGPASSTASSPPPPGDKGGGVDVEASFAAGEYEIVVLSASDSQALDAWLRKNDYGIPEGAEEVLRPYVQNGMKFFVAKVDPGKVTFKDGAAVLSPLRFQFDSDKFTLPVRLGLLNAEGKQDLIVHILARGKRYEASNYKNVTIPTNLDVAEGAKTDFNGFYAALFDRTLEENPGAVVTEYAWDASSCDPCPVPALSAKDLLTLGADVLTTEEKGSLAVTIQNVAGGVITDASEVVGTMKADLDKCVAQGQEGLSATLLVSAEVGAGGEVIATKSSQVGDVPAGVLSCVLRRVASAKFAAPDPAAVLDARVRVSLQLGAMPLSLRLRGGFVLTRLHARYDKASIGEDFAFAEADPIMGGRELRSSGGKLESGSTSGSINAFQGRYALRHPWSGKLECADPVRGEWGGPPEGSIPAPQPAVDLAFAPRGKIKLASLLAQDVPEIGVTGEAKPKEEPKKEAPKPASSSAALPPEPEADEGCACRAGSAPESRIGRGWPLLAALALGWRRRRRGA